MAKNTLLLADYFDVRGEDELVRETYVDYLTNLVGIDGQVVDWVEIGRRLREILWGGV